MFRRNLRVFTELIFFLIPWIDFVILVEAGIAKPQISLNLESVVGAGGGSGLPAQVSPIIKWGGTTTAAGCDFDGGITVKAIPPQSYKPGFPCSLWGKVTKHLFHDWAISTRLDTQSSDWSEVSYDCQCGGSSPWDSVTDTTSIRVRGKANLAASDIRVSVIELSQSIDVGNTSPRPNRFRRLTRRRSSAGNGGGGGGFGGIITFVPRYRVEAGIPEIQISYGLPGTKVIWDAIPGKQRFTLTQEFLGENCITPSITSTGEMEVSYSRPIGVGTLTATVKPNHFVELQYAVGKKWLAKVNAPMEGLEFTEGAKFALSCSGL